MIWCWMLCFGHPNPCSTLPFLLCAPGGSPLWTVSPMLLPSSGFLMGSLANWRNQLEITGWDKRGVGVVIILIFSFLGYGLAAAAFFLRP